MMPGVLAPEAPSFFDTVCLVFYHHLVNLNCINIHHIWVAFVLCACIIVSLHEPSPALLHLGVLELETSWFLVAWFEHTH
jgi:hypothetical protein